MLPSHATIAAAAARSTPSPARTLHTPHRHRPMPAARGPVTLRDFLELGCESSSTGFGSYPRRLPHDDSAAGAPQASSAALPAGRPVVEAAELRRSPSWSPSAFFLSTKSPAGAALARISSLSRSFSRRVSFWRRREYCDDDGLDDRDSCGFPSPLVSSCSASEASEELIDIVIEQTSAAHEPASASSSGADRDCCTDDVPCAAGDGHVEAHADGEAARVAVETMEDKQQLSPVSVLDFPFDEDDDDDGDEEERSDAGTCSPSSIIQHHHDCAANLQKRKKKKIRRFDGPTTAAQVDLEARFAATTSSESGEEESAVVPSGDSCRADETTTASRHEYAEEHQSSTIDERSQQELPHEHRLLARLLDDDDTSTASVVAVDEISEWLLLDFFAEEIGRLRRGSVLGVPAAKSPLQLDDTAALVDAAKDWLRGAGPQWGVGDVMFSGESALKDMDRGRRWMCVREEEQGVAAEVEALVMDDLVVELAAELALLR